jgi:YihY family inner membrane protein
VIGRLNLRRHPVLRRWVIDPVAWFARRVKEDQLGVEAGSMTYGAFLSIPPLMVLGLSIVSAVFADDPAAQERVIEEAAALLPGLEDVARSQLDLSTASQLGIGVVGLIGLAWSASGFAARVRHGLGVVHATERTGLVTGRVAALFLAVPLLVALVAFVAVGVASAVLRHLGVTSVVVDASTTVLLLAAGCVVWTIVYRLLTPGPGPTWRQHLRGAAAFTLGFLVLERFGAVYVAAVIARTEALYGAIGAIFGLLAFLYLSMWTFLLGAEVTRFGIEQPRRAAQGATDTSR